MIEIKSSVAVSDYGNLINSALNCGFTEKNIIFCGSKYSLPTFKEINEVITYFSIYQNGGSFNFADELNVCRGYKNTGMSWDIGLTLSKAQVEAAHDANVLIGAFQITTTSGMFDTFSLGVDWCSTDTITPAS